MARGRTFLARVTREPGDFGIITQEFRFPTLVYKPYRHNEKQYCHYHCTVSLYGLCHNPYNMQVHVQWLWLTHNFALKKLLASNITLNYPEESKSGQGRRRWRQLFEGASANLSILLFAADFSLQFLRPFYLNLPAWHLDGMCNNFQIRPRSRAHSLTLSWKGLKKVSL